MLLDNYLTHQIALLDRQDKMRVETAPLLPFADRAARAAGHAARTRPGRARDGVAHAGRGREAGRQSARAVRMPAGRGGGAAQQADTARPRRTGAAGLEDGGQSRRGQPRSDSRRSSATGIATTTATIRCSRGGSRIRIASSMKRSRRTRARCASASSDSVRSSSRRRGRAPDAAALAGGRGGGGGGGGGGGRSATSEEPIIGDPIGAEGLKADLVYEMIPYTPEELIAIAEQEYAFSLSEAKKAAREMGFGDNWKAAMEKVKDTYVEPGKQPELIRDLARQAEVVFRPARLGDDPAAGAGRLAHGDALARAPAGFALLPRRRADSRLVSDGRHDGRRQADEHARQQPALLARDGLSRVESRDTISRDS